MTDPSRIKMDYNSTYSHHFRLTKKDQGLLRRSNIEWTTLSLQKQGLLFTTPELLKLNKEWERDQKEFDKAQLKGGS